MKQLQQHSHDDSGECLYCERQHQSMKNIGGSILPSSSPEILRPLKFTSMLWAGDLQVIANEEKDTHELWLVISDSERHVLASHPNGFSCFELAKRISNRERVRASEQAVYIVACGGSLSAMGASLASLGK